MVQIIEGDIYNTVENQENLAKLRAGEEFPEETYIEIDCKVWASKTNTLKFEFGNNRGIVSEDELSIFGQPKLGRYLVNRYIGVYVIGRKVEFDGPVWYNFSRRAVQQK